MTEVAIKNSRIVYENPWIRVREDNVQLQSGKETIYGVVEKPDFVVIIPMEGNRIHLVEQFRYAVGSRFWELPQGTCEEGDSTPIQSARRELKEETGLSAATMTYVGYLYEGYGFCTQGFHIYLATDLEQGKQELDEQEEGMITHVFSKEKFEKMLINGQIKDSVTVAAYGLAKLKNIL